MERMARDVVERVKGRGRDEVVEDQRLSGSRTSR
jgi:hypothetical protein